MKKISIHEYFTRLKHLPIIDVRSPAEFQRGHIPRASNLPIFSNEERAIIGTIYKQKGQEQAIDKGLEIAGSKMSDYVSQLRQITNEKKIVIHCWRGGRRSASLAWLFSFVGYKVFTIEKGYKAYRSYVQKMIAGNELYLIVLGGKTGSGKTAVLHKLKTMGEQIIDLERLANHKGSAFGAIGEEKQPFSEYFENLLYEEILELDNSRPVWIENESKGIGRVFIPDSFWDQMKKSPLIHIEIPMIERAAFLSKTYGRGDNNDLKKSFHFIHKRLGSRALKEAIQAIDNQDYKLAATIALNYYDKTYSYNLKINRSPDITILNFDQIDIDFIAKNLMEHVSKREEYQVNPV
ncbi:MAG: tRNA 2-selenouridine(34) synthase MnmH [Bacteroidia bacterium]|nr:tRNA 2-selenouridine(34) synthase MnmH [Bacteroidia bacterium]